MWNYILLVCRNIIKGKKTGATRSCPDPRFSHVKKQNNKTVQSVQSRQRTVTERGVAEGHIYIVSYSTVVLNPLQPPADVVQAAAAAAAAAAYGWPGGTLGGHGALQLREPTPQGVGGGTRQSIGGGLHLLDRGTEIKVHGHSQRVDNRLRLIDWAAAFDWAAAWLTTHFTSPHKTWRGYPSFRFIAHLFAIWLQRTVIQHKFTDPKASQKCSGFYFM